jgi:hypothetical protein
VRRAAVRAFVDGVHVPYLLLLPWSTPRSEI